MDPISSDMFKMLMSLQNKLPGVSQTMSSSVAGFVGNVCKTQ